MVAVVVAAHGEADAPGAVQHRQHRAPVSGGQRAEPASVLQRPGHGAGFKIDWTSIPKAVNDRASEMARGGGELLMKAMFDVIVSETPERATRGAVRVRGPTPSVSEQSAR